MTDSTHSDNAIEYASSLQMLEAVGRVVDVVDTLRRECPWDADQTHASLRPYLLEEAHEVLEALHSLDERTGKGFEHLAEELGDLLFQIVFHARIAAEAGHFGLEQVARGIHDKLCIRHPHVFGNREVLDKAEVVANWENIKRKEKGRKSVLEGIPASLPALTRAAKVIRRAESLDVAVKLPESDPEGEESLGEALIDLVVWSLSRGFDAEDVLRGAVNQLEERIQVAEAQLDIN